MYRISDPGLVFLRRCCEGCGPHRSGGHPADPTGSAGDRADRSCGAQQEEVPSLHCPTSDLQQHEGGE